MNGKGPKRAKKETLELSQDEDRLSHLAAVMNGVDLRLDLGQPRRVDHGQGLDPELRAWKGELDLRRSDLHRDLSVLLQTLPDLVPVAPKGLLAKQSKRFKSRLKLIT